MRQMVVTKEKIPRIPRHICGETFHREFPTRLDALKNYTFACVPWNWSSKIVFRFFTLIAPIHGRFRVTLASLSNCYLLKLRTGSFIDHSSKFRDKRTALRHNDNRENKWLDFYQTFEILRSDFLWDCRIWKIFKSHFFLVWFQIFLLF